MGEETIPLEKLFSTPEALQRMNFFCEVPISLSLSRARAFCYGVFRLRSFTPDRGFVLYHHQTCLGAGYDKEACGKYFLPQLLLYFLRFLDIYDNSLKGALMDNYLEELKRMQMVHMSTTTTTITTTSSSSFLRCGVSIGNADHTSDRTRA